MALPPARVVRPTRVAFGAVRTTQQESKGAGVDTVTSMFSSSSSRSPRPCGEW